MPLPGRQRRHALAILLTGAWALATAGTSWTATAQDAPGLPGLGSSTTTTEAQPETTSSTAASSTTTTSEPDSLLGPPSTSTTSTSTTQPPQDDAPPAASPSTGDGGAAPTRASPFPPELQALTNSIRRTPANDTEDLIAALAPLQQFGIDPTTAALVGFGRFPIAGLASYSHDWWFPRFGPGWRLHEGTDIFADFDTPVRAPVDGTIKVTNGGLGGVSVYVVQSDGTYWYLAHLASTVDGLANGAAVETGDVVGFVGNSGNAAGGPPHVHIEIHPGGGGPIDPKSVLDQFIADAIELAPKVIEAYARARDVGAAPKAPVVPEPVAIARPLSQHAALLWTAAVSPTGGAAKFAADEAAHVADQIDWSTRPERDAPSRLDRELARQFAIWWVEPLVHPLLARLLTPA